MLDIDLESLDHKTWNLFKTLQLFSLQIIWMYVKQTNAH